mgnify:CR=1 FL=1
MQRRDGQGRSIRNVTGNNKAAGGWKQSTLRDRWLHPPAAASTPCSSQGSGLGQLPYRREKEYQNRAVMARSIKSVMGNEGMKLLIISAVIVFVSQSVKLMLHLFRGERISKESLSWVYIWTGEFPSTHSAIIAGMIYVIGREDGLGLLFGFSIIIGALFIYGLLEDKKRHKLFEEYLSQSKDEAMQKIISDKRLLQFNGHELVDVVAGLILGLLVAILMNLFVL